MNNNEAFVAILKNIQKIEGADKIVQADVTLNDIKITQIVVGVDTVENTPVVYFDSNLCINESVISDIDKQTPGYGKEGFVSLGSYLGRGGRVKVIKLRGCISNGLAVDVNKFKIFTKESLVEGYSFTKLGNTEICHKYTVPIKTQSVSSQKKGRHAKKETVMLPDQFHFHIDTEQLLRNIHKLKPGQIISISRKIHGTSAIFGANRIKRRLSFLERVAEFFGASIEKTQYGGITASRSVIKNIELENKKVKSSKPGFYQVDVWSDAVNKFFRPIFPFIRKGETFYYEIVGYLPNSTKMIQKGYSYGCKEGEYKIAIYRITYTSPEGFVFEYSWEAMKERARSLGLPTVEEFFYGKVETLVSKKYSSDEEFREYLIEALKETYLEKNCPDCFDEKKKPLPEEGIVLRVERDGIEVYKLKSENFLLRESRTSESGETNVDDEEASSLTTFENGWRDNNPGQPF